MNTYNLMREFGSGLNDIDCKSFITIAYLPETLTRLTSHFSLDDFLNNPCGMRTFVGEHQLRVLHPARIALKALDNRLSAMGVKDAHQQYQKMTAHLERTWNVHLKNVTANHHRCEPTDSLFICSCVLW
jgi:hypothetical protein